MLNKYYLYQHVDENFLLTRKYLNINEALYFMYMYILYTVYSTEIECNQISYNVTQSSIVNIILICEDEHVS